MPIAAIVLDFDPILHVGDVTIRWQAVALTAGILVALAWTGLASRRAGLRADDLLFLAVAAVPGAVVAGRVGYVLGHADYYGANPAAIVDPAQGGLTLALGVAGGTLTAAVVARLLGTPVRAWLHLAVVPLLLAIAIGKLAMVLAGAGQGLPSEVAWATVYVGPGPWGSLAPEIASHPSQVYEAMAALIVAALVTAALAGGMDRGRSGRAFLAGVGLWALGRVVVGSTWRDAQLIGPLGAEQLISFVVAATCLVLMVLTGLVRTRGHATTGSLANLDEEGHPTWPDPATRPRF